MQIHIVNKPSCEKNEAYLSAAIWHNKLWSSQRQGPRHSDENDTSVYYTDTAAACDICNQQEPVPPRNITTEARATKRLGRIFADIKGPFEPFTAKGERFIIVFVGDVSCTKNMYLLHGKNDAVAALQQFKLDVAHSNKLLNRITRPGQGEEFASREFTGQCATRKTGSNKSSHRGTIRTKTTGRNDSGGP